MKTNETYVGYRVQLHPATDRWVMGDRYGVCTAVKSTRVRIKLDKSGKSLWFHPDNILEYFQGV